MEWTPARIRLLREVGLAQSQHDFARTLGFAMRTVGTERATHPPSLALRRALDQTLEHASDTQRDRLLAAVAAQDTSAPIGTRSSSGALPSHPVRALDGQRSAVLGTSPTLPLDLDSPLTHRCVGNETATTATIRVHRLYQMADYDVAAQLLPTVLTCLQSLLHTLGNLTLTGYNSELSDKSFLEKRNLVGGFADSPLRMNEGLGKLDGWTEEAIQHRATVLAAKAGVIWSSPSLDRETLNAYRPQGVQSGSYTIDDHPHLVAGPMREVFEAFRREVLALDPVAGEDVRKVYVAYKAETNFVDIVPQARQLRLALNMRFPDINDPRGLCRDVTGMGKWGNGDVQFGLSRIEDVPYAVGLARQALENQMGCGEDA